MPRAAFCRTSSHWSHQAESIGHGLPGSGSMAPVCAAAAVPSSINDGGRAGGSADHGNANCRGGTSCAEPRWSNTETVEDGARRRVERVLRIRDDRKAEWIPAPSRRRFPPGTWSREPPRPHRQEAVRQTVEGYRCGRHRGRVHGAGARRGHRGNGPRHGEEGKRQHRCHPPVP